MTPKERAVAAATVFNANNPGHFPGRPLFEGLVENVVKAAIAETRENCAKVAEDYAAGAGVVSDAEGAPFCRCRGCDGEGAGYDIAGRIRRGPT